MLIPRPRIDLPWLRKIVTDLRSRSFSALANAIVVAWVWLLRVPSELLRIKRHQMVIEQGQKRIVLGPFKRKNRPEGSVMSRRCTCAATRNWTCGVCAMIDLGQGLTNSMRLVPVTLSHFRKSLRESLWRVGMSREHHHGTQDLRRGAAHQLATSGCPLGQLMLAGQWSSRAWRRYPDLAEVDEAAISSLLLDQLDESDTDDDAT